MKASNTECKCAVTLSNKIGKMNQFLKYNNFPPCVISQFFKFIHYISQAKQKIIELDRFIQIARHGHTIIPRTIDVRLRAGFEPKRPI
jgi:hypothetical protein